MVHVAAESHVDRSIRNPEVFVQTNVLGTAVMLMEENQVGDVSAFKFTAVPMNEIALEENVNGKLDTVFRRSCISLVSLKQKFPTVNFNDLQLSYINKNPDKKTSSYEKLLPYMTQVKEFFDYVSQHLSLGLTAEEKKLAICTPRLGETIDIDTVQGTSNYWWRECP